jgi:hypothetical protein
MGDRIAECLEFLVCRLELCGTLHHPLLKLLVQFPDSLIGSFPLCNIINVCKKEPAVILVVKLQVNFNRIACAIFPPVDRLQD